MFYKYFKKYNIYILKYLLYNYNILIISKNNNISKISGKYKTIFQINVHKNV